MESNHNELYLVSEEGINLKENLKFNEIVELQIDNDDDDSSLLRSIDDCNIFLKNFNDRHTGLMRILTESMHNLQQDPEVYTCITSLVKYIQLGDNLLHRDRNYAKATYTFMYVLEILEELYGYVRNYLSKSKRDIPNKSENSCYDFKINISPSQVIRDNKECFIIIKRKIFHSMRLIYNKTNNEKKEMILIEKLLNVNNFDFWAICYNCISMYNRMNNNDQIEQFITKVINVSKDTDLVNSLRSFYINLRNKKL